MKRFLYTLILAVGCILLPSCQEQDAIEAYFNDEIVLNLSPNLTRAADTDAEAYVDHVDVFIFDGESGAPTQMVHHERQQLNNLRQMALQAKRSSFGEDKEYFVYLVANSSLSEATFKAMTNFSELLNTKQEDQMIYATGLTLQGAPKYFLMDAIAKDAGGNSPIVLNNGNATENTLLTALLRRAAAKVQITINAADNVEFKNFSLSEGSEGGVYYVSNLSYDAFLLSEAKADDEIEAKVRTTTKGNTKYFTWQPEVNNKQVVLTVYAYPNHWSNTSILEHETCVVVNLPLSYNNGTEVKDYHNSWYKIPMTDDQTLRRNNFYAVNITLDRPGASSESTPIDIDPIYYEVLDWTAVDINVGGEDKPAYLMVNKEEMEMHNVDTDSTTLEFASSSPVTITVKDVYYINKYGNKTAVSSSISGTTDGGLGGNITVNSPNPSNNTIRYFTLVVTNQEGISKEVVVKQYPLVYITNIQSYYSYRSDFIDGSLGDGTAVADLYERRSDFTRFGVNYDDGRHQYVNNSAMANVFFRSKYVDEIHANGLSDVNTYSQYGTSNFEDPYNARMYHIRITASSGEYTLGRPKITNGVTDDGPDNARMVSPSFMIASRIGSVLASQVSAGDRKAAYTEHAKQYVEVYEDPVTKEKIHLNDWRLPTAAELEIIIKYQGSRNDPANAAAMDYLLNGSHYYSASGPVENPNYQPNANGVYIRCIRDVY